MSKQKSLCVTSVTPLDLLLSLQGITAHRRTLFKTCSKSQSLESKLKPSTFSAKMPGFLLSSTALNDFCRTLFFFGEDGVEGVSVLEVGVLVAAFEPGLTLFCRSVGEGVWDDSAIGFFL